MRKITLVTLLLAVSLQAQTGAVQPQKNPKANQGWAILKRQAQPGQGLAEKNLAGLKLNELGYLTLQDTAAAVVPAQKRVIPLPRVANSVPTQMRVSVRPRASCAIPLTGLRSLNPQQFAAKPVEPLPSPDPKSIVDPPLPACPEKDSVSAILPVKVPEAQK